MTQNFYSEKPLIILVSFFISSITIAAILAQKIITIFGIFVPAGVLAYAVTFIITDTISEIWGKKIAKYTVLSGFLVLLFVLALIQLSLILPKAPFWELENSYKDILGSTSRIIIASFAAYLVSQFHDIWAFHFWKNVTKGNHLWLRNNFSTVSSQFIDSLIFITLAFYGVLPIWPLIFGQWVVKICIAILDTPIVYLLTWIIRKNHMEFSTQAL